MIKSDKWIKRQCTQNTHKLTVSMSYNDDAPKVYFFNKNNLRETLSQTGLNEEMFDLDNDRFTDVPGRVNSTQTYIQGRGFSLTKLSSMISPFFDCSVNTDANGNKIPSYGLSSFGYDVRLDTTLKLFNTIPDLALSVDDPFSIIRTDNSKTLSYLNITNTVLDPCDFKTDSYQEFKDVAEIIIPPRGFLLGNTMEYFKMPNNVMGMCIGKSTWARCGLHPLVTPLEPGWEGYLTLEFANLTNMPIRVRTGVGVAQINFFESDEGCDVSYSNRGGKYQNQGKEPVNPLV